MDRGNSNICIHPLNSHERPLQVSDRFYAGDPLAGVIPSHSSPAPDHQPFCNIPPRACLEGAGPRPQGGLKSPSPPDSSHPVSRWAWESCLLPACHS